jgi:hypothetical protein
MKRFLLFAIPLATLLVQTAIPQQASKPLDRPEEPNLVFDDDGGKVQIVPADLSSAGNQQFHGGRVMSSVRQISIFLGAGWSDSQTRAREAALSDISTAQVTELRGRNIRTLRAAPRLEDFSDLTQSPVNDLTIQGKLSEMLHNKAIPAPTSNTVYVVFLAPGIASTLGGHKGGTDYAAYHNFMNLKAGEVRYAVVPFDPNSDRQAAAAARALAETALNPNGTGWF